MTFIKEPRKIMNPTDSYYYDECLKLDKEELAQKIIEKYNAYKTEVKFTIFFILCSFVLIVIILYQLFYSIPHAFELGFQVGLNNITG